MASRTAALPLVRTSGSQTQSPVHSSGRERSTVSALQRISSATGARRPAAEIVRRIAGNTSAMLVRLEVATWGR